MTIEVRTLKEIIFFTFFLQNDKVWFNKTELKFESFIEMDFI